MNRQRLDPSAYDLMCAIAETTGATVKLGRDNSGFALHVAVPPRQGKRGWRGVAYVFSEIRELDAHARLISDWLASF